MFEDAGGAGGRGVDGGRGLSFDSLALGFTFAGETERGVEGRGGFTL